MRRRKASAKGNCWRAARVGALAAAVVVSLVLAAGCGSPSPTGTLTVFAAASLREVFDQLAAEFEKEHPGAVVSVSYDGSSSLAKQIEEGAPADVFASADQASMERVDKAGLVAGVASTFARNSIALAVPKGNPGKIEAVSDLTRPGLRVTRCAPAVPCGVLTDKALAAAGVSVSGASEEQSVTGVATKLASADADAGFVYVTDVAASGGAIEQVSLPEVAASTYPIAVLSSSANRTLATEFRDYVQSKQGAAVLARAGFGAP